MKRRRNDEANYFCNPAGVNSYRSSNLGNNNAGGKMSEITYTLNCDKCGETYYSKEAFPFPQLCLKCLLVEKCLLSRSQVGDIFGDIPSRLWDVLREQLRLAIPIIRKAERENFVRCLENHRGFPVERRHPDSRVYFFMEQPEWELLKGGEMSTYLPSPSMGVLRIRS